MRENKKMITLYGYGPGWTVQCISPYVTKVANYLELAGLDYQIKPGQVFALKSTTPYGKLPVIEIDGQTVADSTEIIKYLEANSAHPLDAGATAADKATMLAFNRMLDEHLYWAAVIQPRWREQANWERYIPIIVGGAAVDDPLRNMLEEFRRMILAEFDGQGMGRLPAEKVYQRAADDINALADFLGEKSYFMGETPRTIDANVLSLLKHIVDSPFDFPTREQVKARPNLMSYIARLENKRGHKKAA
jgi:glutathione S-transferase